VEGWGAYHVYQCDFKKEERGVFLEDLIANSMKAGGGV